MNDIDRVYTMLEKLERKIDDGFADVGKRVTTLEVWKAQAMVIFAVGTLGLNLLWETFRSKFKV